MTCFTPIRAHMVDGNIVFGDCSEGHPLNLSCGRCIGCRKDLSKDWAVRCYHEAQLHDYSCVLTLTFSEENLHAQKTLVKSDIQNFIKSLRHFIGRDKELHSKYPHLSRRKISYLYCGEYGERFERPHYHIIIFGFDFPDKLFLKDSKSGDPLYSSVMLDRIWGFGHCSIGSMSMATAMYCASYLTKHVSEKERGEIYSGRLPEFGHASKKPAIGLNWFKKYYRDILAHDCILIDGQKFRIPRYYKKKLSELFPYLAECYKERIENSLDNNIVDWFDLENKYVMALDRFKDSDDIKSDFNKKNLKFLRYRNNLLKSAIKQNNS